MCKLAPSRAVEPDGVELSGRMASVLMAIPSVLAEAGFATGAGGSGAFAVVGCGVSGLLLFPHMQILLGRKPTTLISTDSTLHFRPRRARNSVQNRLGKKPQPKESEPNRWMGRGEKYCSP